MYARLPIFAVLVGLLLSGPSTAQPTDSVAVSTAVSSDTSAQASPPPAVPPPIGIQALSANAFSTWIAGSLSTGGPIGNIQKGEFGVIALRYHRLLVPPSPETRPRGPALTYTADLFPVLHLSIPPNTISSPPPGRDLGDESEDSVRKRGLDAYGVGASPVGLRLTYRIAKRIQPFIAGSTSIVYFARSVPTDEGKHLNFMFDVGAGVRIVLTPDVTLTAGYRYNHLSNGFRGQINPGVDANLLRFGVALSR